jgi:hypothetical protein
VAYQDAAMLAHAEATVAQKMQIFPPALQSFISLRHKFFAINCQQTRLRDFDTDIVNKFSALSEVLRELIIPVAITQSEREQYSLWVDDKRVHSGALLNALSDHQQQFLKLIATGVHIHCAQSLATYHRLLATPNALLSSQLDEMADEETQRARLRKSLDDPAISSEKLTRFKMNDSNIKVKFGEESLTFSSRPATHQALRGSRLMSLMASKKVKYHNLRELIQYNHKPKCDMLMKEDLDSIKYDFIDMTRGLMTMDETNLFYHQISGIPVLDTTLGDLWKLLSTW